MKLFTEQDVSSTGHIFTDRSELVDSPLWYHIRGLSQTASGYGARLTTASKINFGGKLYRVYCTIFGNAGSCWFKTRGRKIYVS